MGNYCCWLAQYNQVRTDESFDEIEYLLERNKSWFRRRKKTITQTYRIKNFRNNDTGEDDSTILSQRWYHGKISRLEMWSLLSSPKTEVGNYLVRKPITVKDCSYVLSVIGARHSSSPTKTFFVNNLKILSKNKKFFLKNGTHYDTVAELLKSHHGTHEDNNLLRNPCLKPDSFYKFDMDPISVMTGQGDVDIKRHVVFYPLTNEAVVKLVLDV